MGDGGNEHLFSVKKNGLCSFEMLAVSDHLCRANHVVVKSFGGYEDCAVRF